MRIPAPSAAPPRRALVPVAGRGTRMYPATAAVPKELLPIRTRPLLEFALDEILAAGISEIVLVTARGKSAIEDFVEDWCGRQRVDVRLAYVRQRAPRGLGDAVLCAEHLLHDDAFAVVLPDELLVGADSTLARLAATYARHARATISLQPITDEETRAYGVAAVSGATDGEYTIHDLVEKPGPAAAPSRLGIVGRYVLPATIFSALRGLPVHDEGEVELTDALAVLARVQGIRGVALRQRRTDCGSPEGFLEAQLSVDAVVRIRRDAVPGADVRDIALALPAAGTTARRDVDALAIGVYTAGHGRHHPHRASGDRKDAP